ncbi:hypothetical protein CRG98_040039, partial [Punica granatum]
MIQTVGTPLKLVYSSAADNYSMRFYLSRRRRNPRIRTASLREEEDLIISPTLRYPLSNFRPPTSLYLRKLPLCPGLPLRRPPGAIPTPHDLTSTELPLCRREQSFGFGRRQWRIVRAGSSVTRSLSPRFSAGSAQWRFLRAGARRDAAFRASRRQCEVWPSWSAGWSTEFELHSSLISDLGLSISVSGSFLRCKLLVWVGSE